MSELLAETSKVFTDVMSLQDCIRKQDHIGFLESEGRLLDFLGSVYDRLSPEYQNEIDAFLPLLFKAQEDADYILFGDFCEELVLPFVKKLLAELIAGCEQEKVIFENKDVRLTAEITSSGYETLAITAAGKKRYVYSNSDPVFNARAMAAYRYDPQTREYIIFGVGLGYHIKALFEIDDTINIKVFEANEELIKYAGGKAELGGFLANGHLSIDHDADGKKIKAAIKGAERPELIILEPEIMLISDNDHRDWLQSRFAETSAIRKQRDLLLRNCRENMSVDHEEFSPENEGTFGKRAFIIAAGPSLDKNYKELKKKKADDIIIATAPTLTKLKAAGIKADYVVETDGLDINARHNKENGNEDVTLLYLLSSNCKYVSNHKGRRVLVYQAGMKKAEEMAGKDNKPLIETGGSVACAALSCAIALGAAEVVFVGQDLAYTEGKRHAEGTSMQGGTDESQLFKTKDIFGNDAFMPRNFRMFRDTLERTIKKYPQVKYYDATEGGVQIEGAVNVKLFDMFK